MQLLGGRRYSKFFSRKREPKLCSTLNGKHGLYCFSAKVEYMSHVTYEQRYTIEVMLKGGSTYTEIGDRIGKSKSVISREVRRNSDNRNGEYRSQLAQSKYQQRLMEKKKQIRFTPEVQKYVEKKLALQWSPEQISNRPCTDCIEMVSHERIYQHIIEDKQQGGSLYKELRRKKKYKKRLGSPDGRGQIKNAVSIKERPALVDMKQRVGDFEVDLIIGKNHKGAMVTINDRKSGYVKIRLLKTKNAKEVSRAIIQALKPYKDLCKTITSDNGKEFAGHEYISEQLGIDFYFAEPYSSWQRGANENLNGLIRQYFPKKTNFENLTWREIRKVENLLNERPRKRLGYRTPLEEIKLLTKVAFAA